MCKFIKGTTETIGCEENQTPSTHVLESDDLSWMDEVPSGIPEWGLPEYDLSLLDYLTFKVRSNTPVYGFCYGCTPDKDKTIIYDTAYPPMIPKPSGQSNGATWTWSELRRNFLGGAWKVCSGVDNQENINESLIMEKAGISFESRKWADIVYGTIMDNPQERTRLIIDGYDYPEAFEDFPIDYVVIDYYDKLTGYGQEHSGYDKDGNYVVLLYVQPGLVDGKANYNLRSALNHEFKHAWDDYNRLSKGRPSIDSTRESKELYNKDFIQLLSNKQITGPIKDLLKYHYYLSSLERTAYLENVYDGNPRYEQMIREIIRKDFEQLKDRYDLDLNWHLVNTAYDIPFLKKFKSPRDFIDHSAKDLTQKAQKMLKKINKMKYVHGKL